ncbi:cytochrome P450 [Thermothelomyces heterothallicus CBS 203.75]
MTTLALAVLSVPLSIWAVERAYSWLIADKTSPRASSYLLFAGVAFAFDMQSLLLDMTMDSSTDSDLLLGRSTNLLTQASPEAQQFARDLTHVPPPPPVRFYLKKAVAEKKKEEEKGEESGEGASDRGYVFLYEMLKANPPEEYIVDQILSVLIDGRDTTATAMSSVFYFLARNARAVEKLRQEIKSVGVEEPTWEQLKQMKYLNNVIKESLRLFSPVSANSRTAKKENILPPGGGKDGSQPILIPKGMSVRWVSHAMHRNKDVYGPDVGEFRPERWESVRDGWEDIPFGGGPRICLGQQFALTQIAYTVFKFFNVFRAVEARDDKPYRQQTNLTISFPDGCLVSVVRDKRD